MLRRILSFFRRGAALVMGNWALDAARQDDAWGFTPWPLRTNDEWDAADLQTTYKRARLLHANCAPITCAVEQMVRYTGVLSPLPATTDEEWNEQALAAWNARTKNPHTFDLAGRVNYRQAMRFCEHCAIVDGDVAVVPTFAGDGGAAFAFYRAPQVAGGGVQGVETDRHGKAVAYWLQSEDGSSVRIPAWQVVLYQHRPDPTRLRGRTLLASALRNGKDILTIVGYTKQGVKLAASMGLVSTKTEKASGFDFGGNHAGAKGGKGSAMPKFELGTGLSITNLPEGWDIKAISDTRPSQQLQTFFEFLVKCIAQAVTLDPEMLYTTNELGSAAVRFSLEKLRKFQSVMLDDQEVLANRIWRHVISCEVTAGRLRPCRDEAWQNVRWVPERDMTIDTARVAKSQIDLVNELMADNEDYTLRTTGRTPNQLARKRAAEIAFQKKVAADYGISYEELRRGAVGSVPAAAPAELQRGEPEPLPDEDPEEVISD